MDLLEEILNITDGLKGCLMMCVLFVVGLFIPGVSTEIRCVVILLFFLLVTVLAGYYQGKFVIKSSRTRKVIAAVLAFAGLILLPIDARMGGFSLFLSIMSFAESISIPGINQSEEVDVSEDLDCEVIIK